jgi:hypothetical protein
MRFLKRVFFALRPRRRRGGGYGADVLFAGWVDLPAAFREARRRSRARGKSTVNQV